MFETIICLNCGKETPRTKKNKKFCSTRCRVEYHMKMKVETLKKHWIEEAHKALDKV